MGLPFHHLTSRFYLPGCQRVAERPRFALRKMPFCSVKGALSWGRRPCFARPLVFPCDAVGGHCTPKRPWADTSLYIITTARHLYCTLFLRMKIRKNANCRDSSVMNYVPTVDVVRLRPFIYYNIIRYRRRLV